MSKRPKKQISDVTPSKDPKEITYPTSKSISCSEFLAQQKAQMIRGKKYLDQLEEKRLKNLKAKEAFIKADKKSKDSKDKKKEKDDGIS